MVFARKSSLPVELEMSLLLAVGLHSRPSHDEGRIADVVNHPEEGLLDF